MAYAVQFQNLVYILILNFITGTGTADNNAVTGVGFQPDILWTKDNEMVLMVFHTINLYDVIRGAGQTIHALNVDN